ncbi:MAG TPA: glycoside hydrolase family 3 N-terminal domain-containing protein [Thermoleophilaceae bacterium]|nr:glycoside hydrolase family 3 N-terminal domain-containing protein [Thermoleophilaceae bacterium]
MRFPPPAPTPASRRLYALLAACFVALVTGMELGGRAGDGQATLAASGATDGEEEKVSPVEELSLRQQVGQLVVLRFEGPELPTYVEEALSRGEAAGAILFGDNVASEEQLAGLARALQRAAGRSALIAADQEGGAIRIVPFAAPEANPGSVAKPAKARRDGLAAARDLSRLGINVNLAPVADVASVEGSVMAGRAYPGDAPRVAELARAAIQGHSAGGVASTAKHFPGLGAATANTDDAAVTIERPRAELREVDLQPFRAAVGAKVPLIMASHALYPAFDEDRIASQSGPVLQGVLREELGYEGVVVTDSLEAEAVLSRTDTPTAAVRSIEAGADLALTTSVGSYQPVLGALLREARRDGEFRARVEESAGRVLELKERLGLRAVAGRRGGERGQG